MVGLVESSLQKTGGRMESSRQRCPGYRLLGPGPRYYVCTSIIWLHTSVTLTMCTRRHGRDNKLAVWQLGVRDEEAIVKTLPVDKPPSTRPQPWLLHMLTVNTLNFCSFAMCLDGMPQPYTVHTAIIAREHPPPILIAVPNTMDSGGVSIHQSCPPMNAYMLN